MIRRAVFAATLLVTASVLGAEPSISVMGDDASMELRVVATPPRDALAALSRRYGFSVSGDEALPATPLTARLKGPLSAVVADLVSPANRVASFGPDGRLKRLTLWRGTGVAQPPPPTPVFAPEDLPPGDSAAGASRIPPGTVRAEVARNLGVSLGR